LSNMVSFHFLFVGLSPELQFLIPASFWISFVTVWFWQAERRLPPLFFKSVAKAAVAAVWDHKLICDS
jgi:hypothetical protein